MLTGGEPSLYNLNSFIKRLKRNSYEVAVESNGYEPNNIIEADWITYSPKNWDAINYSPFFNELKLIINISSDPRKIVEIAANCSKPVYVQPQGDSNHINIANVQFCVDLIKQNPSIKLSLQLHKMIGIP